MKALTFDEAKVALEVLSKTTVVSAFEAAEAVGYTIPEAATHINSLKAKLKLAVELEQLGDNGNGSSG